MQELICARANTFTMCCRVCVLGWVETSHVVGGAFFNYSHLYSFQPLAITTTLFNAKEFFHGTGACDLGASAPGACRYGVALVNKQPTVTTINNQHDNDDVTWVE